MVSGNEIGLVEFEIYELGAWEFKGFFFVGR